MTPFRSNALVALGGNLPSMVGDPAQTLLSGIAQMSREGLSPRAVSRFYRTPSYPDDSAPSYVNAVVCVTTALSPAAILAALHRIENRFGRERQQRWGMRTLDLDLLAVGQSVLPDLHSYHTWYDLASADQSRQAPGQLILPHPRLQDRAFVLVPLMDIAPDWVHPVLGQSVAALYAQLPGDDLAGVTAI